MAVVREAEAYVTSYKCERLEKLAGQMVEIAAEARKLAGELRTTHDTLFTRSRRKHRRTGPLRALRMMQEKNVVASDLASALQINDPRNIMNVLTGRRQSKPMLRKICDVLDIDFDEASKPEEELFVY